MRPWESCSIGRRSTGSGAVAVLPVILFHAGFGLFGGGFVGVDIFFVISGYLITAIILREMEAGTFSLLHFYERRARRILPALTLVVGVCLPLAWVLLPPPEMEDFLGSIIAVCFFVSNFFFVQESDYFSRGAELEPLLHTWSLAVEEQFYLLFPLFLLFFWKKGDRRVRVILLGVFVASLGLAHWGAYSEPRATFFLLPMRAWELALGAILAVHLPGRTAAVDMPLRQLLSLAGFILIAFAVFAYDKTTPFPSLYALVPTVGAALIIAFATPGTLVGALLASRPLVAIGLISYSAYLWHQPLFAFSRYVSFDKPSDGTMLLLSALTLLLAYLTWRLVECPFRRRDVVSFRALATSAVATGTFLLAFSVAGYSTDSFTGIRFTAARLELLTSAAPSEKARKCAVSRDAYEGLGEVCAYFDPDPSWAVWGNSHGIELSYALADYLRNAGDGVKQLTVTGCAPEFGNMKGEDAICSRWMAEARDFILRDKSIKNVVLSFRTVGDYAAADDEEEKKRDVSVAESYLEIVRLLTEAGKHVFLVLQAPMLEAHVDHYFRPWHMAEGSLDFVPGVDRQQWNRSMAPLRDRLGKLPVGVVVVDPAVLFCNEEACPSILHGKALYSDDDHMSLSGANIVADEIMRRASLVASVTPLQPAHP